VPLYRAIDELLRMPEAQGFLHSLSTNPDPLTRLQFADFLHERGFEGAGQASSGRRNTVKTSCPALRPD
jgi:hypothetical protein